MFNFIVKSHKKFVIWFVISSKMIKNQMYLSD